MVTFPSALSCLESIQISSSKLKFKSEISFGLSIDCSPPIVSTGNKLRICCPPISGIGPFSFCHKSRAKSFFTSNASARKISLGTCLKYFYPKMRAFGSVEPVGSVTVNCKIFDSRFSEISFYFTRVSLQRIFYVAIQWWTIYGSWDGDFETLDLPKTGLNSSFIILFEIIRK